MKTRGLSTSLLLWAILAASLGGGAYLANRQAVLQEEIAALKSRPASTVVYDSGRGRAVATDNTQTSHLASRINALEADLEDSRKEVAKLRKQIEDSRAVRGVVWGNGAAFVPGQPVEANTEHRRSWGPEQALGPPNTPEAGDHESAWAPRQRNAGEEWLQLDYGRSVEISEIEVMETYNPGAISKVVAVLEGGGESTIWEGTMDPSATLSESVFQAPGNVRAKSVKVYLDTTRVNGWNEIDAVKLTGSDGSEQWAVDSKASSSYAVQPPLGYMPTTNTEREL